MDISCRICDSTLIVFLDLGHQPLANDFPTTPVQQTRYPLRVAYCWACRTVQLADQLPDATVWTGDYPFYSSTSPQIVAYHARLANLLHLRYRAQCERLVVEIGCNDGSLLEHFDRAGYRAVGVDPSAGPVAAARGRGLTVRPVPFTSDKAAALRQDYGPAGLIIGLNVLAHVEDLDDLVRGVAALLDPDGVAVFEFQYLPDLLVGNMFDHVYHEHRYYLSVCAVAYVALRHGLNVVGAERIPIQGGSMRVTLGRGAPEPVAALAYERVLVSTETYMSMQFRAEHIRRRLLELLDAEKAAGRTVDGYGAPAKGNTLMNWCSLDDTDLRFVTDTTPGKIGRYTPGSLLPVVGPDPDRQPPDTYLLLAHTYAADIMRREAVHTARGGRWIVPLPMPVLIPEATA